VKKKKKKKKQSHAHHYVPQWYQKRFLPDGVTKFKYLDLHPDTISSNGVEHQRAALLHWGPKRCFYKEDLYTLRFGAQTSDQMERMFFGEIDNRGRGAVEHFANFQGLSGETPDAFQDLVPYMGAQRFRTPRGLDDLKERSEYSTDDRNAVLATLSASFQSYATMWTEGVWEIVRASRGPTKFLLTDDPVTFYCKLVFPSEWTYPKDVSLKQLGTRTIFPLGLDSCLIITHLEFTRKPTATPTQSRSNARFYDHTLKHLGSIQFGRELEEGEVIRINHILKRRATRYVAAAKEEWLYPERHVSTTDWTLLDDDWFMLPNLWRISFTTGIMMGGGKAPPFAMDEYGRKPWQHDYQNPRQREEEWAKFDAAKREWAKKRVGRSRSRTDERLGRDIADQMIDEFLGGEGILVEPKAT
jgi:hypothetical protein